MYEPSFLCSETFSFYRFLEKLLGSVGNNGGKDLRPLWSVLRLPFKDSVSTFPQKMRFVFWYFNDWWTEVILQFHIYCNMTDITLAWNIIRPLLAVFFFFCINILITLFNVISFGIFISFPQKRTGVELALKNSGDYVYSGVYTGIQSGWKIIFFWIV